ncbi:MAG: AAA family ATPase [Methanophagales archaeon]|nr:AAA family ATPase [Methanophagales archaeon]
MIQTLEIENFKSIKHLKMDCRRINLFIGEPNTGKSNILESLGLLSHSYYKRYSEELKQFVRFETVSNQFYDDNLEDKIKIRVDQKVFHLEFREGRFVGSYNNQEAFRYGYEGKFMGEPGLDELMPFKYYKFEVRRDFPRQESEFLLPPSAANLLALILAHKNLKRLVRQLFETCGLRVVLKPQENKIEVQKEREDIIISHPYSLVSDTLQRVIFHLVAIETNKNSIIMFEEPEAHAFPYYTKYLAERIALDQNNNQYFISTHNPYLLLSILEKAPKDDVGIFITYFENYQTKVKPLSEKELEEIMGMGIDIFFDIERFLEVKK